MHNNCVYNNVTIITLIILHRYIILCACLHVHVHMCYNAHKGNRNCTLQRSIYLRKKYFFVVRGCGQDCGGHASTTEGRATHHVEL